MQRKDNDSMIICKVILFGGGGAYWAGGEPHAHVEMYDGTGHLGSLPDMLQPRWDEES